MIEDILLKEETKKVYLKPFVSKVFDDLVKPEKILAKDVVIKTEKNQDFDITVKVFSLKAKAKKAIYFIKSDEQI